MQTLRLFQEVQSCRDCLSSWEGFTHGFVRGHGVLRKGEQFVFAADDLGYLIPRDEHIDVETQLKSLGWHQLETCPKCGSRNLFPFQYSESTLVDVECIPIEITDLEPHNKIWTISNKALSKFA